MPKLETFHTIHTSHNFLAFFVKDMGGWWSFKGIFEDKEETLDMLEKFKRSKGCDAIEVLELPGGRRAYNWNKDI